MSGAEIAAEVAAALAEVGQEVGAGALTATLLRPPVDAAEDPWDTPSATAPTEFSLTVMVDSYTAREIDGELIRTTDKKLMVEAGVVVPTVADRITVLGVTHEIVSVMPAAFGGVDLYYVIQARQ